MNRKIIIAGAVLLLIIVIFYFTGKEKFLTGDNVLIAKIAEEKVYSQTLNYQTLIENCYGNNKASTETSAIKTINQFLELAVLKSAFDSKPLETDLEEKSALIDRDTKAPEILNCVKEIFKKDNKSYLQIYVATTLVNPLIHDKFSYFFGTSQKERNKIQKLQNELKSGVNIENLEGYEKFEVFKQSEMLKNSGLDIMPNQFEKILENMTIGETWPNIIEDDYGFRIIRLLSEDDDKYYCDEIYIPKISFDSWFQDYVLNNIKIEIKDENLLGQIQKDYPDLWWLKIVNK